MASEMLLRVDGLRAGYGDGIVLHDVSFGMPAGSALAILGRNGAGKSTLLLALLGHLPLRAGAVVLAGADVTRALPQRRVKLGLGWVPEGREVFPSLTVDEHLTIAARRGAWTRERVYELFPRLRERRKQYGNQLSGGEQQMLAIGRALMTNPTLLLLDEPLEGLAPVIVAEVATCIRRLRIEERMAVAIVEQHATFALDVTDRAIVLERGRIAYDAPSGELRADRGALDRLIGMRRLHGDDAKPTPVSR